jgi:hypothetical protein
MESLSIKHENDDVMMMMGGKGQFKRKEFLAI